MGDQFESAIAALKDTLAKQHRDVLDTKRSINLLLKMAGRGPEYAEDDDPSSSSVRPDQFYGKGLTTSAAEYLEMRNQACQPEEIFRALEMGGYDFDLMPWDEDDRLRSFSISLAKNTGSSGKFHKLKNGSFGLRSWYEEDFLKKVQAGADATAKAKKKKSVAKTTASSRAKAINKPKIETKAAAHKKAEPKKPELVKPKSSAKEKGRPAADQTAQKAVAS